jgi:hypothetical protein
MRKFAMGGAIALLAMLSGGCATIVAKGTQKVEVSSEPAGANVSITNRAGVVVHQGATPFTVRLKKGAGYFKKESYLLRFSKEGYQPHELAMQGTMSGWYIGNLLFGGLIGMVAVDPNTGAMWRLEPKAPTVTLTPLKPTAAVVPGGARVVSIHDIPAELLEQSTLIAIN